MASERQKRANRLNALKSTGPRTEAGKARSAQNAFRHGLSAQEIVVEGEAVAGFEALRGAIALELNPVDTLEQLLADRLAGLLWRLRRIPAFEAALLSWIDEHGRDTRRVTSVRLGSVLLSADLSAGTPPSADDALLKHARRSLGRTVSIAFGDADLLNKLGRYEKDLMRQVERTLAEFDRARGRARFGRFVLRRLT